MAGKERPTGKGIVRKGGFLRPGEEILYTDYAAVARETEGRIDKDWQMQENQEKVRAATRDVLDPYQADLDNFINRRSSQFIHERTATGIPGEFRAYVIRDWESSAENNREVTYKARIAGKKRIRDHLIRRKNASTIEHEVAFDDTRLFRRREREEVRNHIGGVFTLLPGSVVFGYERDYENGRVRMTLDFDSRDLLERLIGTESSTEILFGGESQGGLTLSPDNSSYHLSIQGEKADTKKEYKFDSYRGLFHTSDRRSTASLSKERDIDIPTFQGILQDLVALGSASLF